MTATMTWNISQLDCIPQEDGYTDVVVTAHWQCVGNQQEYTAQAYGSTNLSLKQGENFIPYNELTQAEVLAWVWQTVDKDETEANIQQLINDQISPPIVSPSLPWAAPATE